MFRLITQKNPTLFQTGKLIRNRWRIMKTLGSGGYGAVYLAVDELTNTKCAVKTVNAPRKGITLKMELTIMKKFIRHEHTCQLFAAGTDNNLAYIVMSLCGPSLADLLDRYWTQTFSKFTSLSVTIQCIRALQEFHTSGFVHRDVKPANFAIGVGEKSNNIYILDFGVSRRYRRSDGTIIPPRDLVPFVGTRRYASLNAHAKRELGPCDDMVSMMFSTVEFLKGDLPWTWHVSREGVGKAKMTTTVEKLTSGLPKCVTIVTQEVYELSYPDSLDYDGMIKQFQMDIDAIAKHDDVLDWQRKGRGLFSS